MQYMSTLAVMPDNARRPRNPNLSEGPTVLARAVMASLEDFVRERHQGLREWRVAYKHNAKDEHVIALIFPAQ